MEDEGVGSDDERPPTTRAAPAESPARESLRPASKKKKPNQQLMIRSMFHAVAYAKAEGLTECFLFFVSDDRLEGFFGMGRGMECGRNFDLLEFEARVVHMSCCVVFRHT
jgi:hypothetical protein